MLPIGHTSSEQPKKPFVVGVDAEVAELMNDDIVNALRRGFDKVRIQDDVGCACATAPTFMHFRQPNRR
jgi:hypothetical protein